MNTTTAIESRPEVRELLMEELAAVSAGTFTPNTYRKAAYHEVGISTSYNFFSADQFMFMGRYITYEQANDIVAIGRRTYEAINQGYKGANKIGYGEEMFINAFNSQIYIKYGIKWNGVAGSDF